MDTHGISSAAATVRGLINKCSRNFFNKYLEAKSKHYSTINTLNILNDCIHYKHAGSLNGPAIKGQPNTEPVIRLSCKCRKAQEGIVQAVPLFPSGHSEFPL
eukprot:TRINITY_DN19264_c0_g1_i2.p2 TRINITY_DN19264_c0_g1~~TRINITY_DN19264_c0_g1_i2.p2  ORF type:complete len:102 (+),score=9.73 TRINITY_DN19264_c0_g1_i2:118-423(+)